MYKEGEIGKKLSDQNCKKSNLTLDEKNKNANFALFTRLLCKNLTLHHVFRSVAPRERAIIDVGG